MSGKNNPGRTIVQTTNGMPASSNAYNACLELFFHGGSYRQRSDADIISLFSKAMLEDTTLALKVLAYLRDARNGGGERRFFRVCLKWLSTYTPQVFNINHIPEIGRWDDVLCLLSDKGYCYDYTIQFIANELFQDIPNSLCAKWMPRKGRTARLLREFMGIYPREYRSILVAHTRVVETQMCLKAWESINYSHVPSIANIKYNKAFLRNDEVRRRKFLDDAKKGKVSIKASVAFPHSIVAMMLGRGTTSLSNGESLERIVERNDTAIAMWQGLPDIIGSGDKRLLFCSDVSGSMAKPYSATNDPLLISIAMGIYTSERLKGPFKNAFITFSANPVLQYTEGNLYERLCQVKVSHASNTDLYKVFKLVLDAAIKHKVSVDEMPTDIVICSDMEFDKATGHPTDNAFNMIRKMYAESGYILPNIVFWNVNARNSHFPIQTNDKGVALISGASQNALKAVMDGVTTPVDLMYRAVNSERYTKFIEQTNDLRK